MAITKTLVKATPNQLQYLLTHDGAAGDALVIPNSDFAADMVAGPLAELRGMGEDAAAGFSQALARQALLADTADEDIEHAQCSLTGRSGIVTWFVDADVDGVSALRGELNVGSSGGTAGTCYLNIAFQHSIVA